MLRAYSVYANDTSFVNDLDSVIKVMNSFCMFLLLSGLKSNEAKCETVDIAALKGVSLPLCGMDYIDLKNNLNFEYTFFL